MSSLFEKVNKFMIVWTLSIFFSVLVAIRLILEYIIHCTSMPWKPKDRILMNPPACLSDPIYGTHKYVTVNVRSMFNNDYVPSLINLIPFVFVESSFALRRIRR